MTGQRTLELPSELRALADREELKGLLVRYLAALDDRGEFDDAWSRSLFTDDVRIEFPIASLDGIEGVAECHRGIMAKWDRTLHLSTDHLIEVDGDRATLRANVIGTHVHPPERSAAPLYAAHVLTAQAVRTAVGWRFQRYAMRLVWRVGDPPAGVQVNEG